MIKTPNIARENVIVYFPEDDHMFICGKHTDFLEVNEYHRIMAANVVFKIIKYNDDFTYKIKKHRFTPLIDNYVKTGVIEFLNDLYTAIKTNNDYINCSYISTDFVFTLYKMLYQHHHIIQSHDIFENTDIDFLKYKNKLMNDFEYFFPKNDTTLYNKR